MWRFLSSLTVFQGEWKFSPVIPNNCTVIRLTSFTKPLLASADFCLSSHDGKYAFERFHSGGDSLLIHPPIPYSPFWRRAGLRGSSRWQGVWIVNISIWVPRMPITPDSDPRSAMSGTTTSVAAAVTSTPLLAANPNRKNLTIYNNAVGTLYVGFGATVTSTNFAFKVGPNSLWESAVDYDGAVVGIWSMVGGNALVTEFV